MEPIKPSDISEYKKNNAPEKVIEAWNTVIARNFRANRYSQFTLDELVDEIYYATGASRRSMLDKGWLDLEEIYIAAGWKVEFDKPGYNESYAANFTFTAPRNYSY